MYNQDNIHIPTQNDDEYKTISLNQNSWCAAEFAKHGAILIKSFFANEKEFINIYSKCLLSGSLNRKEFGNNPYGENIDNIEILKIHNFNIFREQTIILNNNDSFMKTLDNDIMNEFYKKIYVKSNTMENIRGNIFILVSCNGVTYTLLPVLNDEYILLNSAQNSIKLMNHKDLCKNILVDNGTYLHITLLYGTL